VCIGIGQGQFKSSLKEVEEGKRKKRGGKAEGGREGRREEMRDVRGRYNEKKMVSHAPFDDYEFSKNTTTPTIAIYMSPGDIGKKKNGSKYL